MQHTDDRNTRLNNFDIIEIQQIAVYFWILLFYEMEMRNQSNQAETENKKNEKAILLILSILHNHLLLVAQQPAHQQQQLDLASNRYAFQWTEHKHLCDELTELTFCNIISSVVLSSVCVCSAHYIVVSVLRWVCNMPTNRLESSKMEEKKRKPRYKQRWNVNMKCKRPTIQEHPRTQRNTNKDKQRSGSHTHSHWRATLHNVRPYASATCTRARTRAGELDMLSIAEFIISQRKKKKRKRQNVPPNKGSGCRMLKERKLERTLTHRCLLRNQYSYTKSGRRNVKKKEPKK